MTLAVDSGAMTWTVWTARAVVLGWLAALLAILWTGRSEANSKEIRALWSFAAIALLIHSGCAFVLIHEGRHHLAWEHTARRTEELTGWRWGGGLVVNEILLAWWLMDAAFLWWPAAREWLGRRGYRVALHAFVAFLMFNATVVFGPPLYRWAGVPVAATLAAVAAHRRFGRKAQRTELR